MITNDQQLQVAQAAVENLQRVLLAARKVGYPLKAGHLMLSVT